MVKNSPTKVGRRAFLKLGSLSAAATTAGFWTNRIPGRAACAQTKRSSQGKNETLVSVLVSPMDTAFVFRRWGEEDQARAAIRDFVEAEVDILYLRVRQSQCFYSSRIDFVGAYFDPEDNIVKAGQGWGMPSHSWQDWNEWIHFGDGYFQPNGNEWDPARSYVKLAHEAGLKIYALMEQAEAHGWGWNSGFSRRHPQFLTRNREGQFCRGTLSYAYPEVIEFKLNIIREVLAYGFDGIGINLHKGGDHRTPRWDEKGVFYAHYDPPLMEAFEKETGRNPLKIPNDDPEWIRFRAEPVTTFMRKASQTVKKEFAGVEFGAFGVSEGMLLPTKGWGREGQQPMAPAHSALEANLEDHSAWTSERLVDFMLAEAVGDYSWDRILPCFRQQIKDPGCRIGIWQIVWGRANRSVQDAQLALSAGAQEVHYFAYEPFLPRGLFPYTYKDNRPALKRACEVAHSWRVL